MHDKEVDIEIVYAFDSVLRETKINWEYAWFHRSAWETQWIDR
jgi:hypothetical protein